MNNVFTPSRFNQRLTAFVVNSGPIILDGQLLFFGANVRQIPLSSPILSERLTCPPLGDRLLAESTTKELVQQGHAKSTLYNVARKLKNIKTDFPNSSVSDDLQELGHQRDIIKLQKEIAELEATKEKLPDRMATLEKTVVYFRHQTINAVDTALFISLEEAGWNREKAMEFADGWAEKIIKIEK